MDKKQEVLENKIDSYTGEMGNTMIALIALNARVTAREWKANQFIREFSEDLGFTKHIDTAVRIINYLYPRNNRGAWKAWDKIYSDRIKNSAWLKYQEA